jgi:signal transduction histidine kinase
MARKAWQVFLSGLMPRSLFWRVLLIIAGGLLVLQVISFQLSVRERDRVIDLSADRFLLDRISQLVEVMDTLPAEQRAKVLMLFARGPFRVDMHLETAVPAKSDEGDARASGFARNLRQRLNDQNEVRVRVKEMPFEPIILPFKGESSGFSVPRHPEPVGKPPPSAGKGGERSDRPGGPGQADRPQGPESGGRAGPAETGEVVETFVRLRDGEWLSFNFGLKRKRMPLPAPSYETWALTLGGMLIIALAGAVAVIWPLRQFARGVDDYAGNLSLPPMPESGPNEVVSATRALNRLHERLAMLLRNRTDMLTAMSHDLKTPVTRLRLRAETLEEGPTKDKINSDLDEMEALIGATLDYFRAGTASDVSASIRPVDFIRKLVADSPHWTDKVSVGGNEALMLTTSAIMLRRVVTNLVDNAVKYGGSAVVNVAEMDKQIIITVRDQGPGIPATEIERVFEPFYRLEASRNRDTGGSGLGLSIARELARTAGGDVSLHNAEPGLEARLILPRG